MPTDFDLTQKVRRSKAILPNVYRCVTQLGQSQLTSIGLMYDNGDWEAIQACHEQSMCEAMDEMLAEREKEERAVKGRSASLLAKVIVERTDPAHPQSPQQKYRLV